MIITPVSKQTAPDRSTRTFTGSGSSILLVAGLLSVAAIYVNGAYLPPSVHRTLREKKKGSKSKKVTREFDLYRLDQTEDGPVLLRSQLSNDGIWQEGAVIEIDGKWEPAPPPVIDGLEEMTAELVEAELVPKADLEAANAEIERLKKAEAAAKAEAKTKQPDPASLSPVEWSNGALVLVGSGIPLAAVGAEHLARLAIKVLPPGSEIPAGKKEVLALLEAKVPKPD